MNILEDPLFQRLAIVLIQTFFIIGFAIEMYRSAQAVHNERLTRIFWRASVAAAIFVAVRILAGVTDIYYGFAVGWSSAFIMVIFFAAIYFRTRQFRKVMESPRNDELRQALRNDMDLVFNRIAAARDNARKLLPIL